MNRILACVAGSLVCGTVLAQNTTAGSPASVAWGQKVMSQIDGPGGSHLWYQSNVVPGRSYCVELGNAETTFYAATNARGVIVVYQYDGTTVISAVNNDNTEPQNENLSRVCWIHPLGPPLGLALTRLTPYSSVEPVTAVTLRFVETTLFCPWFFVAGDYNAFSLLRNTTDTDVTGVVITWRGLTGAIAGTTTVSIPANGTLVVNARNFVNPATFSNGSIEIAHAFAPEAIVGSTTTLSGTTGLGFDALFEQRKTW